MLAAMTDKIISFRGSKAIYIETVLTFVADIVIIIFILDNIDYLNLWRICVVSLAFILLASGSIPLYKRGFTNYVNMIIYKYDDCRFLAKGLIRATCFSRDEATYLRDNREGLIITLSDNSKLILSRYSFNRNMLDQIEHLLKCDSTNRMEINYDIY